MVEQNGVNRRFWESLVWYKDVAVDSVLTFWP